MCVCVHMKLELCGILALPSPVSSLYPVGLLVPFLTTQGIHGYVSKIHTFQSVHRCICTDKLQTSGQLRPRWNHVIRKPFL